MRVLCGLVRWSYAVVFALMFQVSKWVSGCVVLEAVRVVHVIVCKCVVQRRVAGSGAILRELQRSLGVGMIVGYHMYSAHYPGTYPSIANNNQVR